MKQIILLLLLGLSTTFFAQNNAADRSKHFNLENGLGIQGYDPVAYFTQGKAVKGSPKLKVFHQGVVYSFSSEANKQAFIQNAAKYEPQYGGWCAYAMGEYGTKVEIDPATFKIVDGKLYLFYNAYLNNTLKSWNKDEKNLKAKADKNWSITIKK